MTQEQHVLASDRVDQTLEPLHPVPATGGALTFHRDIVDSGH